MKVLPLVTAAFLLYLSFPAATQERPREGSPPVTVGQVRELYEALPLRFEPNVGQADASVRFLARGRSGSTLFLTETEAVLALRRRATSRNAHGNLRQRPGTPAAGAAVQDAVVRMMVVGARNGVALDGVDSLPERINYLTGADRSRWRGNIPTYGKVRYREIYRGVDLMYYSRDGELEFDFVLAPGASHESIELAFAGVDLTLDASGDLVGRLAAGEVRLRRPVLYQQIDGRRADVDGGWMVRDEGRVAFEVGSYDATQPLVIDPVLSYSTYLGRSGLETITDVAVDAAGNAYVVGETDSPDFPATAGAFQQTLAGFNDVFVSKVDPAGATLVYSTYLGGRGSEAGTAIAIDALGQAHVVGVTHSADFPVTAGAFQGVHAGGTADAFAAKLDASGSTLLYATFLGGSDADAAEGLVIDTAGNAYVSGATLSPDFPTTPGAFQTIPSAGLPAPPTYTPSRYDAFVAKLAPAGTALVYSTYFGGTSEEYGVSVAVDATGNAYLTGTTRSANLPTTDGAFQRTGGGLSESAFVTKMNPSGSALVYSTYLDGSHHEFGSGIAVDAAGQAFVTGGTQSVDFPTTAGAYRPTHVGDADAFVTRLDALGASLVYSTYLGGSGQDWGDDIAIDSAGNAHVVGTARSTDFPVTPNTIQAAFGGELFDSFVAKLAPTGSSLVYSTYLGGNDADFGSGITVSADGLSAYVSGFTSSTNFPATPGAIQRAFAGHRDGFLAKITDIAASPSSVGHVTGGGAVTLGNSAATFSVNVERKSATGAITGHVQFVGHRPQERVRSVSISSLTITGNAATIQGACVVNRTPCTFSAVVTDNGDPGNGDSFTITVAGRAAAGGALRNGNVRVRVP